MGHHFQAMTRKLARRWTSERESRDESSVTESSVTKLAAKMGSSTSSIP